VLKDCFEGLVYGQLRTKLQNFKVKSRGTSSVNQSEAYWATYTYNDTKDNKPLAITALIYMFVKINHRFIITATSSSPTFSDYEPQFREIIHSINASNQ
jgi:hypothetical protein